MIQRLGWLLVVGGAFVGCARSTRVETGTRDQVLHIGNGAEPEDLDPNTYKAEVEFTIDTALFEGLVEIANDGKTILPGVAERWEVSADGLVYTFHLRPNAQWSDGSALTADDFLYSFRRVFTPTLACENAVYGFAISGARDFAAGKTSSPDSIGVKAIDPHTFEIRVDHPTPYLLYVLGGAPFDPVPRAVVEHFGGGTHLGTAWTRPGNLVSNGPFMLASWHPNQDLVAVRNPHYWDDGRVRLREIHFYPIDDADVEERAFRAGQLHVTYSLPLSKIAAYRQRADPQLHVTPQLYTDYVIFNTRKPPFDDVRIRRAFSLVVDRDRLVPLILSESATPAHSLTRPGTDDYLPPSLIDCDPAQGRRLLAEAGYPGGAGFPAIDYKVASPRNRKLAEALQQTWQQELGVRVTIAPEEQKTMFNDASTGNFQLVGMGFFYAINAPETMLMVPLSDSLDNYTGWKEPAYDAAFRRASYAGTAAERRAGLDAMEHILNVEVPFAPLFFIDQPTLVSAQVKGWRDNALGIIDWRELSLAP
jgi:oligopeptide transport system substrate-binding protein